MSYTCVSKSLNKGPSFHTLYKAISMSSRVTAVFSLTFKLCVILSMNLTSWTVERNG